MTFYKVLCYMLSSFELWCGLNNLTRYESKECITETCGRENGWGRKWEKNSVLKAHDKIVFFV